MHNDIFFRIFAGTQGGAANIAPPDALPPHVSAGIALLSNRSRIFEEQSEDVNICNRGFAN